MPDPGKKPTTGTIDVPGLGRKSMYDQDDLLQSVFVAEEGLVEPESVWITRAEKNGAEYTSISHVYDPLNKLLDMLLSH